MAKPQMNTRRVAVLTVLTATCIALQISLRPPNVEFTSFLSFIVGMTEGAAAGALLGGSVMLINGFVSPWGFGGLNVPFQMAGMIIAGILGGIYCRFTKRVNLSSRFSLEPAVLGAIIALIYDLITNVGFGLYLVLAGESLITALSTTIAFGALFSLVHVITNTTVFGILFLPVTNALSRIKVENPLWLRKEHSYS